MVFTSCGLRSVHRVRLAYTQGMRVDRVRFAEYANGELVRDGGVASRSAD